MPYLDQSVEEKQNFLIENSAANQRATSAFSSTSNSNPTLVDNRGTTSIIANSTVNIKTKDDANHITLLKKDKTANSSISTEAQKEQQKKQRRDREYDALKSALTKKQKQRRKSREDSIIYWLCV